MQTQVKRMWAPVALVLTAGTLHGSGFAIIEQSVSGLGNAFAGGSAAAEDASTLFYNPAGMTVLTGPQLQVGANLIMPQAKFHNEGSLTFTPPANAPVATQGKDDNGGKPALVPNIYYVQPLAENLYAGIGLTAPFGLVTEYDDAWVGRYVAIKSDLKTYNLNPSIAWRVNSQFSIGAGFDIQRCDVELSSALDLNRDGTSLLDGKGVLKGNDTSYGFNVGALYQPDDATRVGIHFRSAVDYSLKGDAKFTLPALPPVLAQAGAVFHNQDITADLSVPETLSVSIFRQLNSEWSVMADATWTKWSRFKALDINYSDPVTESLAGGPTIEDWKNTMRYSVGATYSPSATLKLRLGVAYDESPVPNKELRSPRIPDNDRLWVAGGVTWTVAGNVDLSAAYVHIFVDDPVVSNSTHTSGQYLKGTFTASVDIVSAMVNVRF